jgi:hypothetical protein
MYQTYVLGGNCLGESDFENALNALGNYTFGGDLVNA